MRSRLTSKITPKPLGGVTIRHFSTILLLAVSLSILACAGCLNSDSEGNEHGGSSESEGDEESGTQFALSDTFDEVRAGARLILSYDATANAFIGTVENTTSITLSQVRVEVHLSNGTELGPTTPIDLDAGQSVDITLPATSQPFTSWSAHPEVG